MRNVLRIGGCVMGLTLLAAFASAGAWAIPGPAAPFGQSVNAPEDSFLASDDYHDKGEIKDVFLKDPEYAKMMEDFSRNDSDEFDWGWAAPDFNLGKYHTVHVTVKDDFGLLNPDFKKYVKEVFSTAMKRLHLKVVGSKAQADLELGLDIVDYDADSHYAFVTMIQPQVELEIRLREGKTGKDLVLIRNEEHDHTPKAAATETARDLMQALR